MSIADEINKFKEYKKRKNLVENPEDTSLVLPNKPELPDEPTLKKNNFNIYLKIASFFSVLFSVSLSAIVEPFSTTFFIVLAAFFVGFIANEGIKINFFTNYFLNKNNFNLIVGVITLFVSLTSIYGIYNLVNKEEYYAKQDYTQITNTINIEKDSLINFRDSLEVVNLRLNDSISNRLNYVANMVNDRTVTKNMRVTVQNIKNQQNIIDKKKIESNDKKISQLNLQIKNLNTDNKITTQKTIQNLKKNKRLILSVILSFISLLVEISIVYLCYLLSKDKLYHQTALEVWKTQMERIENEYNALVNKIKKEREEKIKIYQEYVKKKEEKYYQFLEESKVTQDYQKNKKLIEKLYYHKDKDERLTKAEIPTIIQLFLKDEIDNFYQLLQMLNIISGQKKSVRIALTKQQAFKTVDEYYTNLLNKEIEDLEELI